MGLFGRKNASRDEIIDWAAARYARRAESLEAREVILAASQAGMSPTMVMSRFLDTQWPIVVEEAGHHFRSPEVAGLVGDAEAMEAAVRRAAPAIFPLTWEEPTEELVGALRYNGSG